MVFDGRKPCSHKVCYGKAGTGMSFYTKALLCREIFGKGEIVFFDPEGEYSSLEEAGRIEDNSFSEKKER